MTSYSSLKKILQACIFAVFPILFLGFGIIVTAQLGTDHAQLNEDHCFDSNLGKYICRYMSNKDENFKTKKARWNDKEYEVTNTKGTNYFMPFKTDNEADAFLNAAKNQLNLNICQSGKWDDASGDRSGIDGCKTNGCNWDRNNDGSIAHTNKNNGSQFGDFNGTQYDGYKNLNEAGTAAGCCVVQRTNGTICRVKNGTATWSVVNQKKWKDGTPFEWSSGGLGGSASQRSLWQSKSNSSRTTCATTSDHNKLAWDPQSPGGVWKQYKCYVDHSYCFWGWCGERWDLVSSTTQAPYVRTYVEGTTSGDAYSYNSKCTEGYYTFSGTYESLCYQDGNGEQQAVKNWNPLTKTALANLEGPEKGIEGWFPCTQSCSDYNRWSKVGIIPSADSSCSSSGYNQTRIGACSNGNYCGQQTAGSACDNYNTTDGQHCNTVTTSQVIRAYNEFCTKEAFKWEEGSYGACNLTQGYGSNSGYVSKWRSISCKEDWHNGQWAAWDKCDADTRPESQTFCDASQTKYYWKQDDNYSGCTASCGGLKDIIYKDDSPYAVFKQIITPIAHATYQCSPGQTSYPVGGTEYKKSKCHKVIGNSDTVVANSECTNAGLSTPYEPSRSCSRNCPCDEGGGNPI